MAAIAPLSGNNCRGQYADGTPNIQVKCVKSIDDEGDPVYACTTWRYFKVNCPKVNFQCSSISGAYVAAITVCRQALY